MSQLAPLGPVYQAGTLSGNPLATAAGLAVLARLDEAAYQELADRAARLGSGLSRALSSSGWDVHVPVVGPLVGIFFATSAVTDFAGAKASAGTGRYPGLMHGLLDRGVALAPGAYEVMFPSLSHTDADIDRTVEAAAEVAATLSAP
jgi:glutamate-1-semialdehyde 2,1-aminomutase